MNKPLTEKQLWTLGNLAVLSPLLRLVPGATLAAAENAGWICPILALPGLLVYGLFLRALLRRRRAGETLPALLQRSLGPVFGGAVLRLCGAWFLLYGGFLMRIWSERFFATLRIFGLWLPFALVLLALAIPAAAGGRRALGRASQLFLPVLTGILLLVLACAIPQMTWGRLKAVSVHDTLPALAGAVPIMNVGWGTLLVLGFLAPAGTGTEARRGLWWTCRLCLTALALSAMALGVLGSALTAHLSHPFFILLRNISLSSALERIEALVTAVWVLPDFVMLSSLLLLVRETMPIREKPLPTWLLGGVMLLAGALLSPTAFGLKVWSETILPVTNAVIVLAVPALGLLGSRKQ